MGASVVIGGDIVLLVVGGCVVIEVSAVVESCVVVRITVVIGDCFVVI